MLGHDRNWKAIGLAVAWLIAVGFVVVLEANRIEARLVFMATTGSWYGNPVPDATFILPVLLLGPICWLYPCRFTTGDREAQTVDHSPVTIGPDPLRSRRADTWKFAGLSSVVLLSLVVSVFTSRSARSPNDATPFHAVLPVVHDELSYLFQAKTILAGRWWWPGPERAPELFHQMHVMNEGRFASRYLPGTGAWIAPFLAIDRPVWGHWIAGMLAAALVFAIGCRIGSAWVGFIAGLLVSLCPGMAIFNNLLLAHQPALVGLLLFIWSFLKMMDKPLVRWAVVAGIGLSYGMLCRPLTAAAVGLPFGIWLAQAAFRKDFPAPTCQRLRCVLGLAAPLFLGFGVILVQNHAITGNWFTSAYGLYTRLYTPRHAFGFNNGLGGASPSGTAVLQDYNDWPENLTPRLAVQNLWQRFRSSLEWTLGFAPLAMAAVALFFGGAARKDRLVWLIFGAIVALHVLHIPYWLDGILHYHYVFESGPLWLLLFAYVSVGLIRESMADGRFLFLPWWTIVVGISVAVNHLQMADGSTLPRIRSGIAEITHASVRYRAFHDAVTSFVTQKPALVLVKTSRLDLHVEYVRNQPPFDADVLVARYSPALYSVRTVHALFPERTVYVYDTETENLERVAPDE